MRSLGWNVTSYQILNPGFSFWFDPRHDAVIGYVERHDVRVVGGAPVCADAHLPDVMEAFERDAAENARGVFYFCAEERLAVAASADPQRRTFPIGAQPYFRPQDVLDVFRKHASLRAQLHRARNKNVTVRRIEIGAESELRSELNSCLEQWRARRPLPPMHFLIETDTLARLEDRVLMVAFKADRPVAFLVATPIPARNGWLVEQIVRGGDAPNGSAELLLHGAAVELAARGAALLTLGLAPLAARARPIVDQAPQWLTALLRALRSHGRRFYNFEGLEAFKAKFRPAYWAPVYASVGPHTSLVRALLAVGAAFSGEPLRRFVPHSLARGLTREVHRLTRWR